MQLTLLIPELIWPEPDDRDTLDALDCPALGTLLARSRRSRRAPQSFEASLSDAFVPPEGEHPAPYAALRLLGEAQTLPQPDSGNGSWLACDPVHLRFHQEHLILAGMGHFGITLAEAQTLVTALNDQLAEHGRFHATSAERWYLQLTDPALTDGFSAAPLSTVAGRRIERLLAESTATRGMRRLVNDIQMILHAHPLNQQRENAGQMTINSLWLWGAGALPPRQDEKQEKPFDGLWSDDPLALGLARQAGITSCPPPADAATLLAEAGPGKRQLLILDTLLGPVQYENSADYRQAMMALEQRWFAPLKQALAAGRITRLRIDAPTAYATLSWECRRSDLWKFWRRPRPLAHLAQQLANESNESNNSPLEKT
jgi:hypothetical protein